MFPHDTIARGFLAQHIFRLAKLFCKIKHEQLGSFNAIMFPIMSETNFLQSAAWAKFQRDNGNKVISENASDDPADGKFLAIIEHGQISNRLYLPYGPNVSRDKFTPLIKKLRTIAGKQKLDFIRIEPTDPSITPEVLHANGFRPSARFVDPPTTVISDLSGSEDDVRARLTQTARRYAKKCDKAGIAYSVSYRPSDIKYFLEMIHEVSARTGAKFHDDLYFQMFATSLFPSKSAGLLFAELNGEKIASIVFCSDGHTMSYTHAANKTAFRKYSPATGLGLYALLFAKKQGCQWFDWFGVAPEKFTDKRYKSWAGLTQFKMSFGGERISRVGTWELPLKKQRYWLYRALLKITGRS